MNTISAFCQFYQKLDQESVMQLPTIYAQNVVFIDPVKEHQGLAALTGYFENLLENTENCTCDIKQVSESANSSFVRWVMHYQHPKLAANKPISVHGLTELRIENGKVVYHRDYYDMGELVYEHVPVLGRLIRWLKSRLAN